MKRIRIQAYGPSNSAKELSTYLQIPRIKHSNSKYVAKPTDVIINWGIVKNKYRAIYVNPVEAVLIASNKLHTLNALQAASIKTPAYGTSCTFADDSTLVFARTTLSGHSGEGIVVGEPSQVPSAPLYTEFINKKYEYRAIVCVDEVVDFKQKLKKKDWEGDRSPYVWNVANGYIFARNEIRVPDTVHQLAIDSVKALGLTYGAVDIIEDVEGTLYVLEINTAFGLENSTIALFGDKLHKHIMENY